MKNKTIYVELDGEEEFEVTVEYDYRYTPAKLNGLPENCYPEEEESEIIPPKNLAELVKKYALEVMVPRWIKSIEGQIMDMEIDDKPKEWAEEDSKNYDGE